MAPQNVSIKQSLTTEVADETTPLIGAPETGITHTQNGHAVSSESNGKSPDFGTAATEPAREDDERMPYLQILVLCYGSLAEPVAYFSIFPFVNQMIKDSGGVPEDDVGFWSGMIESLFSLVQMLLMILYGNLANRLGRKPILVFSLTGVSIATALFGLSKDLWHMIFFRCLAGVFAGSVLTTRTMLSENTNKKTQGRAFSWYMFTKNLGIFIGPIVGGGLSNPADQYPKTFGHVQFFIDYPYALATIVAGAVCLSGALLSLIFLKETFSRKDVKGEPVKLLSTWQVLQSPNVPIVLYIYGHVMALALAYTAVCPVFQFTSIEKGGFSFTPQQISIFLAIGGGSQALWMLIAFPIMQKRFGTGNVLRAAACAWPFLMMAFPIWNEMLRAGWFTAFWVVSLLGLTLGSGVSVGFACVQLCINDISPSPAVLGTLNALALAVTSGIRAVMPALATSVFAMGVKWGWAHGHLIWIILVAMAVALAIATFFLPEAAEGRPEGQVKLSTSDAQGEAEAEADGVVR